MTALSKTTKGYALYIVQDGEPVRQISRTFIDRPDADFAYEVLSPDHPGKEIGIFAVVVTVETRQRLTDPRPHDPYSRKVRIPGLNA